jgi:hypothetical protein
MCPLAQRYGLALPDAHLKIPSSRGWILREDVRLDIEVQVVYQVFLPCLADLNLRFWRTELSLETAKPHTLSTASNGAESIEDPHRRQISRGAG